MTVIEPIDIGLIIAGVILVLALSIFALRIALKRHFVAGWSCGLIVALEIVFIIYLIRNLHKIEPADWSQLLLVLGLVAATGLLGLYTAGQANASVRMAKEMRNARSPSITITWIGADRNNKKISAILENEGFGPALNLSWYLTHKELHFDCKQSVYPTFKAGQKYTLSLPSENFDFEVWNGLSINCDYGSILGGKFRSILRCDS